MGGDFEVFLFSSFFSLFCSFFVVVFLHSNFAWLDPQPIDKPWLNGGAFSFGIVLEEHHVRQFSCLFQLCIEIVFHV